MSTATDRRSTTDRKTDRKTLHSMVIFLSLGILNLGVFVPQSTKAETTASATMSRYPYPEAVVSGFIETCRSEPSQLPPEIKRQLCTCLVSEFQNQYSYAEFEAIGKRVQSGQLPPPILGETVDRCVEKVLKLQK
jgi:hypothetical protein